MTETISWSKLRTWRRCHKQYEYKYVQRLVRKRPEVPLLRGRILGECLDAMSIHQAPEEILAKYQKEYARLFDEEREMYGDLIEDCRSILVRYDEIYENDKLTYLSLPSKDSKTKKPYEIEVRVDLGGGLEFLGYVDKVPQDEQGRIWVMDHKSHKNIPDEDARFADLQLVLYVWGLDRCDYDIPQVSGVLWDYLRTKVPTVPQLLKSGELSKRMDIDSDYATYMATITGNGLDPKNYTEILESLKGAEHNFFQRVRLPKPPKVMIDRVVTDMKTTAAEIKHLAGVSTSRTMDRTCSQCSYYNICQTELRGLDGDFVRKSDYIVRGDSHGFEEKGND